MSKFSKATMGILFCLIHIVSSESIYAQEYLESKLKGMLRGDRTGLCLAVAIIDKGVQRAIVCANDGDIKKRKLNFDTAFEIGSITKTMTATVLAGLIRDTDLSLDTPLSRILPKNIAVPKYENKEILLRHIVTHSSGLPPLPSRMQKSNIDNPYAKLRRSASSATPM